MKELLHNIGKLLILVVQIIFYSLQLLTSNIANKVTSLHLIGKKHDRTKRSNTTTKDDATFI